MNPIVLWPVGLEIRQNMIPRDEVSDLEEKKIGDTIETRSVNSVEETGEKLGLFVLGTSLHQ